MKYVKEVVTKEDGRLMEYYWFDVGADIIRPKNPVGADTIHQQNESPHADA
ncbi:MAG: hypothetical protein ACYC0V_09755 [Armatimonadota bacterium]